MGACLGAQRGVGTADGVPADWIAQVGRGRHMLETARQVVDHRAALAEDIPTQTAKL